MIVCFLGYLLAVSVFFTTFVHKNYVVLKMEKVYAHRESGMEANIIGCATYEFKCAWFRHNVKPRLNQILYLLFCINVSVEHELINNNNFLHNNSL